MRFIDLFGGIGGFRLGIERATNKEWNCVWYCDVDKYAVQIYNERFGEDYEPADIRKIHERDIPGHDLICAGFPCQSFSTAGKRKGMEDTRGTLFFEICRIAKYHKPKMLLLENVRGLLSHDGGRTFGTILESLGELGYDVEWQVLNSKDYGVPQNRERVFIIGHPGNLSGRQVFPIGESNETPTEEVPSVYCLDANYSKGAGRGARTMILHNIHGGYGEDVRTTEKCSPIRRLTPVECERLQSFPDGWTEGISDTQRYKCLGNAVTVNVVDAIISGGLL